MQEIAKVDFAGLAAAGPVVVNRGGLRGNSGVRTMNKRPLVLVDVDTQRDFLDPSGSLYIPGSGRILANLGRLTQFARTRRIPVIATACAHTPDEVDSEPFPPHCLVGTEGQRRIAPTDWPGGVELPIGANLPIGTALPDHLTIHKSRYDVFSRPDAAAIFGHYARPGAGFVVYGVATDYCVRAVVLGLRRLGHEVKVVVDAVWAIDQAGEVEHFAEFVTTGAVLTLCDVVCHEAQGEARLLAP